MSSEHDHGTAVIGGGAIGLRIASQLEGEVVLIEAEEGLGSHQSTRNSGVIHSGIYNEPGSLKDIFTREGRDALYDYAEERAIPHKKTGKLIVGNGREQERINELARNALANKVEFEAVGRAEIRELQEHVRSEVGLYVPSTGIIDTGALLAELQNDVIHTGHQIVLSAPVVGGEVTDRGIYLEIADRDRSRILFGKVVNAAGLGAQSVARSIRGIPPDSIPQLFMVKGNYFRLSHSKGTRPPFSMPVYPVPEPGGLGVHATPDLHGQIFFGPDVEQVDELNYEVNMQRIDEFYRRIRMYYPGLRDGELYPHSSGIRASLSVPGQPEQDFIIQGPRDHGIPGLVNLYGLKSPALTGSFAIADYVARQL